MDQTSLINFPSRSHTVYERHPRKRLVRVSSEIPNRKESAYLIRNNVVYPLLANPRKLIQSLFRNFSFPGYGSDRIIRKPLDFFETSMRRRG